MSNQKYNSFIFFSAGPVGDHAIALDDANRFFEATGRHSYIISKHPNPFLSELIHPYNDHVTEIGVQGLRGYLALGALVLKSIVMCNCYVLILPIPLPRYMRFFAYFIRFCTRSRFVGLTSLCGFSSPVGPKQSATFLGKGNYLDARVDTQLFYEQANNLLEFLGYKKVDRVPTLTFQEDTAVFSKFALTKGGYIVFHLVASSEDKSLPTDRWNRIIQEVRDKHPEYAIVFTGAKNDYKFVKECLGDIPESDIVNACGDVGMAGLLTLYKNAKVTVSVHTGNAILVNMLHVPTVMVNMRGVYMFKYHYNKKSIDCTGVEGCTCNPLERHCAMTPYKGKEYMACVFSNNDALILEQITTLCR